MDSMTREQVYETLRNWSYHDWQIQGFGMLRTYLEGEKEPRLQVWDQRLATWGNNAIHDHPWAFKSTIFAGVLFNQRYQVKTGIEVVHRGDRNGHVTQIVPGTRGGKLSERPIIPCQIIPHPIEVYALGDSYGQGHREMHLTRYLQGTVTLITRTEREEADLANVAWFGRPEEQPPFVNPTPASPEIVVKRVVEDALERWWL